MKKLFILILFISLVSCVKKKSCGEIVQKYNGNGKYYFAMRAIGSSSGNDDIGGGDVFGDAEVSKKIYEPFKVGEEYCIE
jgi:hypothetical protein